MCKEGWGQPRTHTMYNWRVVHRSFYLFPSFFSLFSIFLSIPPIPDPLWLIYFQKPLRLTIEGGGGVTPLHNVLCQNFSISRCSLNRWLRLRCPATRRSFRVRWTSSGCGPNSSGAATSGWRTCVPISCWWCRTAPHSTGTTSTFTTTDSASDALGWRWSEWRRRRRHA